MLQTFFRPPLYVVFFFKFFYYLEIAHSSLYIHIATTVIRTPYRYFFNYTCKTHVISDRLKRRDDNKNTRGNYCLQYTRVCSLFLFVWEIESVRPFCSVPSNFQLNWREPVRSVGLFKGKFKDHAITIKLGIIPILLNARK